MSQSVSSALIQVGQPTVEGTFRDTWWTASGRQVNLKTPIQGAKTKKEYVKLR